MPIYLKVSLSPLNNFKFFDSTRLIILIMLIVVVAALGVDRGEGTQAGRVSIWAAVCLGGCPVLLFLLLKESHHRG